MDLNVFDPNNTLRRVFTFAAALPTNSTLSSLNAAMQTLKEGGSGLQWMAGTASSAFVFANRNVVIPLLKAATPPIGIVSSNNFNSRQRAADPLADAEQLQFAQARGRRGGRIVLKQQTQQQSGAAKRGKSKKKQDRPVLAGSPALYSLSLANGQTDALDAFQLSVDEEPQHESVQLMHMGLQSSLL